MTDHNSAIVYIYQTFYKKIYGNEKYVFNPTPAAEKQISKFIKLLDEKYKLECVGINFMLSYFVFQFSYWANCDVKEKTNWSDKIQLAYIIGDKAFMRWILRDVNFDWTISQASFLRIYKISTQEIESFFKEEKTEMLNIAEEIHKKVLHNTVFGFHRCITTTTLYFHRSTLCINCKFKNDCKILLKNNYSNIYIERGYGREKADIK